MGTIARPVMRRQDVTVRLPGASSAPMTRIRARFQVGAVKASRNGSSQAFRTSGAGSPPGPRVRSQSWVRGLLGVGGHDGGQYRQPLGWRYRPVHAAPVGGLALDALAVGEVPPGAAGPVRLARREVEPDHLGPHDAVGHHLAGKGLEPVQKRGVVGFGILEAVAPLRPAGRAQVGRVAVDQLRPLERERIQERMGAAVHQLDRSVAGERRDLSLLIIPSGAENLPIWSAHG